ncbi:MAG TPA: polysaccharide pyruvyl transferase family protein, partial [bacterium]|nr:polysaccharide pyruvyl transferase family protein [bacterium]
AGDELILEVFRKKFVHSWEYIKSRLDFFRVLKASFECDVLVFPGGGILQDETGFLTFYYYIGLILLFLFKRKKIYLVNQGMGPLGRINRWIFSRVLRFASFISVRDRGSYRLVRRFREDVSRSADTVFALTLDGRKERKKEGIGIIPRGDGRFWKELLLEMRRVFPGEKIYIFPFHYKRDFALCRRLASSVPEARLVTWEESGQILDFFPSKRCLLLSPYHALLLAVLFRVPFGAVPYSTKVKQLLEQFGLSDRALNPGRLREPEYLESFFSDLAVDEKAVSREREREEKCFKEFLKCLEPSL